MTSATSTAPRTFAEAQAVLAARLPGYTERPGQMALASFIEQHAGRGSVIAAEAGCGIGKSLAYLIPAIQRAVGAGTSVVVATSTRSLQDQLGGKDLPFLQEHLGIDFTWAVLKGKANYLCQGQLSALAESDPALASRISALLEGTDDHSGDRADLGDFTDQEWRQVSVTANDCVGRRDCPFAGSCFSEIARDRAAAAQVKIVNTALLMTDLIVREASGGKVELLGGYELVIIDEAHELLDAATSALGFDLADGPVRALAGRAASFAGSSDQEVVSAVSALWGELDGLLTDPRAFQGKLQKAEIRHSWIAEREEPLTSLLVAVSGLRGDVRAVDVRGVEDLRFARAKLLRQLDNLQEKLRELLVGTGIARWAERETRMHRGSSREVIILKTAPVDVAPFLSAALWQKFGSVIISATLSVAGDFSYVTESLGLGEPLTFIAPSPFDFSRQARLLIPPKSAPDPKKSGPAWRTYAQQMMLGLIRASPDGGALLLFTSASAMKEAHAAISPQLRADGRMVLMQGQGGNKSLAGKFAADTTSVLFGLKSFMVGVDFQGAACSLVIMDKLPFPVPSDILFAARCDDYDLQHGARKSFGGLSMPIMAMTLIQGLGRLIRHADDTGVMAVLDPRLASTGYGRQIARALPPAPRIESIDQAARFFAGQ